MASCSFASGGFLLYKGLSRKCLIDKLKFADAGFLFRPALQITQPRHANSEFLGAALSGITLFDE